MDTGGLNSLKPTRHLWEHLKGKKVGQNYYKITSKTKEECDIILLLYVKISNKKNPWYHSYMHSLVRLFLVSQQFEKVKQHSPIHRTHKRAQHREKYSHHASAACCRLPGVDA